MGSISEAAPHEPGFADRVVGRAEGTLEHEGLGGIEPTAGAPDASGLQAFLGGEVGQDRTEALGEERFAGPRAADHQEMIPDFACHRSRAENDGFPRFRTTSVSCHRANPDRTMPD